jgi:O-antigen ligase
MNFLLNKKLWLALGGIVALFVLVKMQAWFRWTLYAVAIAGSWLAVKQKKLSRLYAIVVSSVISVVFLSEILPGKKQAWVDGRLVSKDKPFNDGYPDEGWY